MSKLREYLNLIPKGFPNSLHILEGIVKNAKLKHGMLKDDEIRLIIRRRVICHTCPFNNLQAISSPEYKALTGELYETNRDDFHCSLCGCPLDIKTACPHANCGAEEWNTLHPDNQIELKWKAV